MAFRVELTKHAEADVYRVLFWIDSADRAVYVLHVRRGSREQKPGSGAA